MRTYQLFGLSWTLFLAASAVAAQGVVVDKSEIRFISKQMGANIEGRFRKWKANVDFRPRDPQVSRADLEIDLASIDLASEEAETEVQRSGWFDTAKFPVARFQSTAMKDLGGDKYEVAGKLTLKGIVKEMAIPVSLRTDPAGNSVVEGQFTVKRLDFKIGSGQWADPAVVADDVLVRVRLTLSRAN